MVNGTFIAGHAWAKIAGAEETAPALPDPLQRYADLSL
jgi:hypothetical protein